MRHLLLLLLILGINQGALAAASTAQSIREISSGNISWSIQLPDPSEIAQTETGIEFPRWNSTVDHLGRTVPVLTKLVYTHGNEPQVTLSESGPTTVIAYEGEPLMLESAKGLDLLVSPHRISSNEQISIKHISTSGDYSLWSINVLGLKTSSTPNRWQIPLTLRLEISGVIQDGTILSSDDLYLNQPNSISSQHVMTEHLGLGTGKFKLYLLEDGIYRIYYDSLVHVDDFPDDEILSSTITLKQKGEQQPIYVFDGGDGFFDSGDYFDFIGIQNYFVGESQYYDPFTDLNVYWMDWGTEPGLRFVEESGALIHSNPVRPTTFWETAHVEKDSIFDRLGQVDTDLPTITRDHYFWNSVNSGQHENVQFILDNPFRGSSENVTISIGLHGLTYSTTAGEESEHTLFAFLNDHSIGEGNWTQQEEYTLTSPNSLNLSHNILFDGNNHLSIFAPVSVEAGNYDRIVLNWIKIGYEHLLIAKNDKLRFRKSYINPSTNLEFEIKGFSSHDLVLYKEGLSKITGYGIRENWESEDAQYSLVFQDEVWDATPDYWSSTVNELLQPVKIIADTSAALRSLDGDFIVITIPEFIDGTESYIDFKHEEGWNPVVVSIADIYDEFNHGINSPYAIRDFLKFAHNNWPSRPEHVLLIGDAITNPQASKRDTRLKNIPTFYMQTYGWGAAEADYWFSLINGDDFVPDINIGRIPSSSSEDLEIALDKYIRYGSNANYGSWQNEIITIAGFENTFKTQSEGLLKNNIPQEYMPSRIFIDRDSEGQIFWGDTDSLVAQWNAGKILINFLGHGGGAVWADRSLFVRDDIQYLDSDVPPAFITSMTCFTASFAQTRGLGEVVITESPAGAIGWFGSSGVGWVINDYLLIQPLLRRLLEEDKTVGELINIARMEYFLANSGYDYLKVSMLFQYNYLGDPTTRLKIPEAAPLLSSHQSIYETSDQLNFSYISTESGQLDLLPINASGHPWHAAPATYDTELSQQFLFNQEEVPSGGKSRTIYTLDRGPYASALHGTINYSISEDWFEHYPLTASELEEGYNNFRVRFHTNHIIPDSMVVDFSGGYSADVTMVHSGGWWELPDASILQSASSQTFYAFKAYSGGIQLQLSGSYRLYLPGDISLTVSQIHSGTRGNKCGWILTYSLDGMQSANAQLRHEENGPRYQQSLNQDVEIFEGNNTLFIPSFFSQDTVLIATSLTLPEDVNSSDNMVNTNIKPAYLQIVPNIGLSFNGISPDTLKLWKNGYLVASRSEDAWLKVEVGEVEVHDFQGLTLFNDSTIYSIDISSDDVSISLHSENPLFLKAPDLPNWQIVHPSNGLYRLDQSGIVAMGLKQDFTGPDVSMMMEGQLFFDGDYLSSDSRLNLIAEDNNGFAWKSSDASILVDGIPVVAQLGDTTISGGIISLIAQLDLGIGEHTITYSISDALGNWSEPSSITGVVAGEAEIIDHGNFPNPFQGETLIIYELTQALQDVEIEIFTISGYKLHVIDQFNARVSIPLGSIGYHEIPWNGRNRLEQFVANGVYFYRIKGQLDGEVLTGPVGKMMKNR